MNDANAAQVRTAGRVLGWVGPVVVVVGCVVTTGIVLNWPRWTGVVVVVVAIAGLIGLAVRARRTRRNAGTHWVPSSSMQVALAVVMALTAVATAVTMYWQWGQGQRSRDSDFEAVAKRAAEVAELMTTVSPESRDEYMAKLQPLLVDGMAASLKSEVLDRMSENTSQKGVVRAVGVQGIVDGIASVITVVQPTTPGAPAAVADDGQSPNVILWLFLIREDGQWKLRNSAPMIA